MGLRATAPSPSGGGRHFLHLLGNASTRTKQETADLLESAVDRQSARSQHGGRRYESSVGGEPPVKVYVVFLLLVQAQLSFWSSMSP